MKTRVTVLSTDFDATNRPTKGTVNVEARKCGTFEIVDDENYEANICGVTARNPSAVTAAKLAWARYLKGTGGFGFAR